jgi:RNA polymerase sigma-70 factor (ECF subfamily)
VHFISITSRGGLASAATSIVQVNGGPGVLVSSGGQVLYVVVLDRADERVQTIRILGHPDKLRGLSSGTLAPRGTE